VGDSGFISNCCEDPTTDIEFHMSIQKAAKAYEYHKKTDSDARLFKVTRFCFGREYHWQVEELDVVPAQKFEIIKRETQAIERK